MREEYKKRNIFPMIFLSAIIILCTFVNVIYPSFIIQWNNMKSTVASVCEATGKISYCDKIAAMLAMAYCRHARSGARQEHRIYRVPFDANGI